MPKSPGSSERLAPSILTGAGRPGGSEGGPERPWRRPLALRSDP